MWVILFTFLATASINPLKSPSYMFQCKTERCVARMEEQGMADPKVIRIRVYPPKTYWSFPEIGTTTDPIRDHWKQ
jgi:hypothetical protein